MCMFCAAIPATAAVSANINAKQIASRRTAEETGTKPPAEMPIKKITIGVIVLLVIGSVVYHTIIYPIWRI